MKYQKNQTMRMLGHQCIFPLFDRKEVTQQYVEVFDAIANEHPIMDKYECIDLFMLGYIWGKRDERVKRKRGV